MNYLTKFITLSRRYIHKTSLLRSPYISEVLSENRSLIRVQGDEVVPFLQGLITNDMKHLQNGSNSIYAMFLNKSGRVLHDSIIYKTPESDTFIIETDKKGSNELRRHLRLFRVRRKIDIDSLDSDYLLWVLFQNTEEESTACNSPSQYEKDNVKIQLETRPENVLACTDPRVRSLGIRVILPKSYELKKLFPSTGIISSTPDNDYKLHRYKLGVSEGMDEHGYEKIFPFETNIDYLHGISFHKGCYLGQELTARTFHTGVIRKRIMPIKLKKPLASEINEVKTPNGTVCGTVRGMKDDHCLAVLRIERVLQQECLFIDGNPCNVIVPSWWPKELPNKMKLKEK